jgi:hypothetical protein
MHGTVRLVVSGHISRAKFVAGAVPLKQENAMRVRIVSLVLIATPFLADVSAAQGSKSGNQRNDSNSWQWLDRLEDRWNSWKQAKKCDKNDRKHERDNRGRDRKDERCEVATTPSTPSPAPSPAPSTPPTAPVPPMPPAQTGAEIRGTLYSDLNFNGARDAGEPALVGWAVELEGTSMTVVTDADGSFAISGVPVGSYFLCATAQAGWSQIMPSRGEICASGNRSFLIDVLADAPNAQFFGRDFGYTSATGG